VIGELSAAAAERPGLRRLPVVGGAGDGQSAGWEPRDAAPDRPSTWGPRSSPAMSGATPGPKTFRLIGAVPGTYLMETLLQAGPTP
jgi:hypothetical protein